MGTATKSESSLRPGIEVYSGRVTHLTGSQFRFGTDYNPRMFVRNPVDVDGQQLVVWTELRDHNLGADERMLVVVEISNADEHGRVHTRLKAVTLSRHCLHRFDHMDRAGVTRSIFARLGVDI